MSDQTTQQISIEDFSGLCQGSQVMVNRTIDGWINKPEGQRALVKAVGLGGSSYSLPKEDVLQMFQTGVIALDENKLSIEPYKRKYEKLLRDHGIEPGELKKQG